MANVVDNAQAFRTADVYLHNAKAVRLAYGAGFEVHDGPGGLFVFLEPAAIWREKGTDLAFCLFQNERFDLDYSAARDVYVG